MNRAIRPRRFLEDRLSDLQGRLSREQDRLLRRRYRSEASRLRKAISNRIRIEEIAARNLADVTTILRPNEIKMLAVDLVDRSDAYTQHAAYRLWPGVLSNADKIEGDDA